MSKIKLEVGKAYRSRNGKEVKIVERDNGGILQYPYEGSDGEWYSSDGRFDYDAGESPHDLIEEVGSTSHTFALVAEALTATRYTFDIPDGMKKVTVSQEGNRIIVEMVPEDVKTPKPGDVLIREAEGVYIFKSVRDDGKTHKFFVWLEDNGSLLTDGWCLPGRPATTEEAQPLFDALKKAGKRWNPEAMWVENVPEIDRIREWVGENIMAGYYNHEDVAEAIEEYLKQKEDKK